MEGWIKIHRKIMQHDGLWLSEKFNDSHAWIDLLLLANHKKTSFKVRGIRVEIDRGQVGWTKENLAKRWKWSRGKVLRFLQYLQSENMIKIEQQNCRVTSLITIANYNDYQQDETTNGQQTVQQTDNKQYNKRYTDKNDKNDNNENKLLVRQKTVSAIADRKRKFVDEVMAFKSIYPDAMLNEFYTYWTEQNPAKTKMRFEMNKTWQTSLRLKTWANREKVTNGTTNGHKPVEFLKTNKKISV